MRHLFENEEKELAINQFKIDIISRFCPFSSDEITKYLSIFDTYQLIENPHITWDLDLISTLSDKLDWTAIWKLKNAKFDLSFFKRFENCIDFHSIQYSRNIVWNDELLDLYGHKFNWSKYLISTGALSTVKNLRRFVEDLDWKIVSRCIKINLTEEIIDEFIDRWDWENLSSNPNLPLSKEFINKYIDKLDFKELSKNPTSLPLIYQYPTSTRWNWDYVIMNRGISYDKESFDFMFTHFERQYLLKFKENPIYKKFALSSFLGWVFCSWQSDLSFFLNEKFLTLLPWDKLSRNYSTNLSLEFISANKEKLNFNEPELIKRIKEIVTADFVIKNHKLFDKDRYSFYLLPLTIDSLSNFYSEIDWNDLSYCEKLDWNWDFLEDNFEKFNPFKLSTNKGIYEQLFEKTLTKVEIIAFLDQQLERRRSYPK